MTTRPHNRKRRRTQPSSTRKGKQQHSKEEEGRGAPTKGGKRKQHHGKGGAPHERRFGTKDHDKWHRTLGEMEVRGTTQKEEGASNVISLIVFQFDVVKFSFAIYQHFLNFEKKKKTAPPTRVRKNAPPPKERGKPHPSVTPSN